MDECRRATLSVPRRSVNAARHFLLLLAILFLALPFLSVSARSASAEDRTLKLYFAHTGEKAVITYKRDGRFDPRGLAQLNQFLRDWRENRVTKMDPRLFDLVWEVYRRSGATDYIHVVSAFRSPPTNNMLRTRSPFTGVAKNSQHMLGKAMDFYIPGVKLATLRAIAMQMQIGGVGFYPTSGSPFVHLDVGNVRAWPRMQRDELVKIFPNGHTLHLPADGKPLPGYDEALADYKKRVGVDSIAAADTAGAMRGSSGRKRSLFAMLFGGGGEDEVEDNEESKAPATAVASATRTAPGSDDDGEGGGAAPAAPVQVASAQPSVSAPAVAVQSPDQPNAIAAPIPMSRPAFRNDGTSTSFANALYGQPRNPAQDALAMQTANGSNADNDGYADLAAYHIPVPTMLPPRGPLPPRGMSGDQPEVTLASAGPQPPEEIAALPASVPLPASIPVPGRRPASGMISPAMAARDAGQSLTPGMVAALSRSADGPVPSAPIPSASIPPASMAGASVADASRVTAPVPAAAFPASHASGGVVAGSATLQALASLPPAPAPSQRLPATRVQTAAIAQKPSVRSVTEPPHAPQFAATPMRGTTSRAGRQPVNPAGNAAPLTKDVLEKWALDNKRSGTTASLKAPRLVTRAFSSDYSAAYSNGFRPVSTTVAIDPNRFSGPTTP